MTEDGRLRDRQTAQDGVQTLSWRHPSKSRVQKLFSSSITNLEDKIQTRPLLRLSLDLELAVVVRSHLTQHVVQASQ